MSFVRLKIVQMNGVLVPPAFKWLLGMGLAYILPVLLADTYYRDDLPHAMSGLTLWERDGRPLASVVSSLVSFAWPSFSSPALYDTSPLPQLLGILALAYGAARLAARLFPDGAGLAQALVVFPVTASPFMLQNLSYKFDALTMALAITLALMAALTSRWTSAFLLLLVLMLYQPAFNAFAGAAALLLLAAPEAGQSRGREFLGQLMWACGALIVYALAMKLAGGFSGSYASGHSALVPLRAEGLGMVLDNMGLAGLYVAQFVADAPALGLAGALAMAAFGFAQARQGAALRFIAVAAMIFLAVPGLMLFLKSPAMLPRSLMGFSVLLVFAAYCLHETLTQHTARLAALGLATAWFFALAATYANALKDEARFDAALGVNLSHDLLATGFVPGGKLAFDGTQPMSAMAATASRRRIIGLILRPSMNGNSEWGFAQLEYLGLPSSPVLDATPETLKSLCQDKPALRLPAYQIFIREGGALVSFPNGVCFQGKI